MKTAREQLCEEVTALLGKGEDVDMVRLMARYRVQTKPGIEIPGAPTARDALGDRLGALLRNGSNDDATRARIGSTIDEFRMQLKQAGAEKPAAPASFAARPAAAHKARGPTPTREGPRPVGVAAAGQKKPAPVSGLPPPRPPSRPGTNVTLGVGEAPARLTRGAEPVAGGPRARKKARGECPKCHSMGVVLARSYSGDEYYSCIYCGWQAYKPVDDNDPNAAIALRLLGQTAGTE